MEWQYTREKTKMEKKEKLGMWITEILGEEDDQGYWTNKEGCRSLSGRNQECNPKGGFFYMKKENRTTFDELLDVCIEKMTAQKYFETLAHASEEMTKRYLS